MEPEIWILAVVGVVILVAIIVTVGGHRQEAAAKAHRIAPTMDEYERAQEALARWENQQRAYDDQRERVDRQLDRQEAVLDRIERLVARMEGRAGHDPDHCDASIRDMQAPGLKTELPRDD